MKQLSRRVTGWRVTVAFCFLSVAMHLGWIFFLALDAHFAPTTNSITHRMVIAFSLLVGFVPPLLLFGAAGFRVGRLLVEKRLPAWIEQIAAQYGVEKQALEAAAAQYRPETSEEIA